MTEKETKATTVTAISTTFSYELCHLLQESMVIRQDEANLVDILAVALNSTNWFSIKSTRV